MPAALRAAIAQDLRETTRGQREARVRDWAARTGRHPNTIRRWANGTAAGSAPAAAPPDKAPWVEALVRVMKSPPKATGRSLSLRRALALALEHGMLPPAARQISETTWRRWERAAGLLQEERRVTRWQAEYPNQVHQFDASQSRYFRVDRVLPDGEAILRLHPTGEYKNKPLADGRQRWWLYGLVDDCSGYRLARGVAALGENWGDALDFVRWAWEPKDGGQIPFCGRPETLLLDNGPLEKSRVLSDLFARLGILKQATEPGNPQSHGKVENPWRDLWMEFELPFFVAAEWGGRWQRVELTGAEYNRRLLAFLVTRNELLHRAGGRTKREAWQAIAARGGPVLIPDEAWQTAIRPPEERRVGRDGCFSFENITYQVDGLLEATVRVLQGAFDDRVVAVDVATGRKYEARVYGGPLAFGTYRAAKAPPGISLREAPPAAASSGVNREASGEAGPASPRTPHPSRSVAAFKPRATVAPMPADPRAGAIAHTTDPVAAAIEATAGDEAELDRYAVLELFRGAGIPEAGARAFLWARLPGAATVGEAQAAELLAEFRSNVQRAISSVAVAG